MVLGSYIYTRAVSSLRRHQIEHEQLGLQVRQLAIMGMFAPPIYILAVVVLAFGGIPKGTYIPLKLCKQYTNHVYLRLR
jgi:hypothetical protein